MKDDKYKHSFAEKLNVKNIDGCHRGGVNHKYQGKRDIFVSTAEEVWCSYKSIKAQGILVVE